MESGSNGSDQPIALSRSISIKNGNGAQKIPYGAVGYHASSDASLFSSSLPVLPHEKLDFDHHNDRPVDDSSFNKLTAGTEEKDLLEDLELNALPGDEDELLAGIMEALGLNRSYNQLDDLEEYDLFGSGGGIELEYEPREHTPLGMQKLNMSDMALGNSLSQQFANGVGKTSGEHPYGEHPSRTLFVRNINSNVEDSELTSLFKRYGDIRTLYTACKHRGFVMVSYFDIRAARTAMCALQGKPLRRRNLDIHFSIPKDNPSEKDINQGTLVIFNLDPSVSNDDLLKIFGVYGEVKEIRETPNKRHHKFIEYYDVRAAEAALKALNKIEIAGKRIKLEPSRPGGARRSLMQQLTQELERDEAQAFRTQIGSPVANSPPGNWSHFGSPRDHSPVHAFSSSPVLGSLSPVNTSHSPGLASVLTHHVSVSPKLAPIGKDQSRASNMRPIYTTGEIGHDSSPHSSGNRTLSGPEFLWGSPKSPSHFPDHASTSLSTSPAGNQHHPFSYTTRRGSLLGTHQHHVGSAPSGGLLDRHLGCFSNSPDTSFMRSAGLGIPGLNRNNGSLSSHIGPHGTISTGFGLPGSITKNGSPSFRMMSVPRPLFHGNGSYTGFSEAFVDRSRGRIFEHTADQIDSKKQFQLDLDKIISGEDTRTTLMIKNIPNKYTSKMLLAAIDENHGGTYDFLYLPIDFKNKCNMGYAFINMVSPSDVISFYQTFYGTKWEKFNSEKVASLAYARIQGKAALVAHFQNSSLMNEDKRCQPIVFQSQGQHMDDQEHLLSSNLNICIRQPDGSYCVDALESPTHNP